CGQAGYDTQLAVYEGCDCQALSDPPLACNNDGVDCPPGTSLLVTDVVQGNCYLIRVGSGSVSPVGSGTLTLTAVPPNDECATMIEIDRLDANETIVEPVNMQVATASPEDSQCLGGPNTHKDLWYCLSNNTGVGKLVTITSDINVLIEITAGCLCPPGPLVACLPDIGINNTIEMAAGEQVTLRLINYLDLPDNQLQGTLTIINAPPPKPSIFHLSQASFDVAVLEACNATFSWDFTPNGLPPGGVSRPLDDPLDINTHADNPSDPWGDLWPPEVDNVQFSSNMNPAGPLEPRIVEGLAFVGAGVLNLTNDLLAANVFTDSFNVVSGPRGATRVAMSMELVSLSNAGVPTAVVFRVTVFDSMGAELAAIEIPAMAADQVFLSSPPLRHNDDPADFLDPKIVANTIRERGTPAGAYAGASAILPPLLKTLEPDDLVLVMSNGSFDGLVDSLISALHLRT
ncbi:MAG: hypothetical protein IIC18_00900, partial [Bacteroidetes bacterium]|nr:hypothetical protein [Bacteroidota bacterium]